MQKVKVLLPLMVLLACLAAQAHSTPSTHHVTKKEAVDKVMSLPEVRESAADFRQKTKNKRKLFHLTYGEPDKDHPYWWIVVGEDNGMCFVTHLGFYVNARTGKIRYVETLEGKSISLKAWRESLHRKK